MASSTSAAAGTWTWNPTDGWFEPTTADPSNLEPCNGNFVGVYDGTWLWNGTTQSWSQLTTAVPNLLKACGNNLLWASAACWHSGDGTLPRDGLQLTTAAPESLECFGGDAVWEGGTGTWLYNFSTGWSQITRCQPDGRSALRIEARLVAALETRGIGKPPRGGTS